MTLKQKFRNLFKDHFYKSLEEKLLLDLVDNDLEEIADDYAIEFAKWLVSDWTCDERWTIIVDEKELLEIFKKEKGW
jgi:hypothetical protein